MLRTACQLVRPSIGGIDHDRYPVTDERVSADVLRNISHAEDDQVDLPQEVNAVCAGPVVPGNDVAVVRKCNGLTRDSWCLFS